jgi:aspartyl aminopeptidase
MDTGPARALCRFIDDSPSPMHAAVSLSRGLGAAGFAELSLDKADWQLAPGKYLVRRGASVAAFIVRSPTLERFALVGAHTDSPHLRLKPRAAFVNEGCRQLGVEVYGGALLNSWLDRDLGLAGTVHAADGSMRLVCVDRPIARVAQLAIHLDRKINDEGLKLNPQLHLAPIWGLARDGADVQAEFAALLERASGVPAAEIVAHDLSLYELSPSRLGGADEELILAPRLDNLASCHAGMVALTIAGDGDPHALPVLACLDHEEVGSGSDRGADGSFLGVVLERIALALNVSRAQFLAALARSLMLSADMAHAAHPNYGDRHEPRHKPILGKGPVLKANANQRYATSGQSAAALHQIARRVSIPLQDFVARTDLGCGSTIGPIAAARLGVSVADVGSPMLSMHSARECAAAADHAPYIKLLAEHLRS